MQEDVGLMCHSYVLLSIGNISTLFGKSFESCWGKYEICSKNWISAISYLEIVGIIIGQVLVGIIGDWIGRRWGLLQDAWIMILGLVMLVCAWGTTQNGWVICYAWSLFIYGIGVGEYLPPCLFGPNDTMTDWLSDRWRVPDDCHK